jgi:glycosyltransferase involved in cell wall biosynthesis
VIPEHKVERSIQLNNTVDTAAYTPEEYATKDVPVIVHAPTSPGFKGTKYIEAALDELKDEGHKFEYKKLHGVPNDEAHRIYREEADIIIDQVLAGGFGTLAIEGMYYGKPVCCYLLPELLEWYPDCPIVNTSVDNLKKELARLIERPDERVRLGREGRAFVEKHFSREKVNRQVWDMYREVMGGKN